MWFFILGKFINMLYVNCLGMMNNANLYMQSFLKIHNTMNENFQKRFELVNIKIDENQLVFSISLKKSDLVYAGTFLCVVKFVEKYKNTDISIKNDFLFDIKYLKEFMNFLNSVEQLYCS